MISQPLAMQNDDDKNVYTNTHTHEYIVHVCTYIFIFYKHLFILEELEDYSVS